MLTGISAIDGFVSIKPGIKGRIVGISLVGGVIFAIALSIPQSYLESFQYLRLADAVFPGAVDRRQPRGLLCCPQGAIRNQRHLQPGRDLRPLVGCRACFLFLGLGAMTPFISLGFTKGPSRRPWTGLILHS